MIIKGIISVMFIYIIFIGMGSLILTALKKEKKLIECVVYGMIITITLFEVVCFPFLIVGRGFNVLFYLFSVCLLVGVLLGIRELFREKIKIDFNPNIYFALFGVLLLTFVTVVSYGFFNNTDDGYYLTIANIAIEQNVIETRDAIVYSGNEFFENISKRPSIASWELLIAFYSKLFGLHPTIFARTFYPWVVIPVYSMAYMEVIKRLVEKKHEIYVGLCVYLILVMSWGNGCLTSTFLAVGAWSGKTALFHLVLPVLLSKCLDIVNEDVNVKDWILIGITAVAGIATTATGLYTVPIYCASMAIPYMISLALKRRFAKLLQLLRNCILSMCGVIGIGLYSVVQVLNSESTWTEPKEPTKLAVLMKSAFEGNKLYVYCFIFSIILILILEKKKKIVWLYLGQALTICIALLNPISAEYLAQYVTGVSVYWRMVLLLPVVPVVILGVLNALRLIKPKKLYGIVLGVMLIALFFISDSNVFSFHSKHQNMYMIRQDVLQICQKYDLSKKETITILADQEINRYFRQYSSWFNVVFGRNTSVPKDEKGMTYLEVYETIFGENRISEKELIVLNEYGVQYVITLKELDEMCGYELDEIVESIYIYKRIGM